jgi:hypothetical protein
MKISIPITIIDVEGGGCHLLIKSRLNAEVKGHLIIDTGASSSAFDHDLFNPFVDEIYLASDIQSSGVSSESLNAKPVRIKKMWIGRYRFQISQAVLIDLNHIKQLYLQFSKKNIIGLLGGNFLKEHRAIIDYKNHLLHLHINK